MMKPLHISISVVVAVLWSLLAACGPTEASRVLGEIEDYMDAHPDTRLDDLLDIDSAIISRTADRMLYEVLLTQAIDKAHGSIAARDSVMQVAADWFTGRSDTRHALLANYFLGRVKFEKEDYPESLVAMFKAHDLAKELDDKFWIGMSARGIADVYLSTYNFSAAAEYTKVELDNIKQTGRQPYINYAMLDLGRAYCANTQCVEATIILNQIIDSASTYADSILCFSAKELMARTLLKQNNYEEALTILKNISNNPDFSVEDSTFLGLSYLKTGNIIHAQKIMQDLSQNSDAHTQWLKYMVNKSLGSFDEALKYKENDENIQANDIIQRFNVDLYSLVIDYYNLKEKSKAKELKDSQTILWLFITIITLSICIATYIGYNYYRSSQERIDRNVAIAQSLRETLAIKNSEYDIARAAIREKMRDEFSILDELCQKVYESENPTAARKRVSAAVTDLIEQLSGDKKKIENLKRMVDRNCDNVISDFKKDLPGLKEADYNLFLYSILGFSTSTIALFLKEEKLTSVYERKRRLKDKIKQLNSIHRDNYLDFLR